MQPSLNIHIYSFWRFKGDNLSFFLAKAKCLINIAMFSGCIIIVNVIDWNWNIDSRYNGKIDIAPLHSYFPRYTLLSESIISKEEIGNY